jgi:predicted lactoylglutathione lyase
MAHIDSLIIEASDPAAATAFYRDAFGLDGRLQVRPSQEPTTGFRGFTISLVVPQPSIVDLLIDAALEEGATPVKPVGKSLWGYGGVVQAPDGAIWKVASSKKKNTAPATRTVDDIVLLIGSSDVKASKRFYVDQGFTVKRSFGSKYAEFDAPASGVKLALYGRSALAKDAGVEPHGSGSARIAIASSAGTFTDPDGFSWEPAAVPQAA